MGRHVASTVSASALSLLEAPGGPQVTHAPAAAQVELETPAWWGRARGSAATALDALTVGFIVATLGMAALTALLMMILGPFGFFSALLIAPLWAGSATCGALAARLWVDPESAVCAKIRIHQRNEDELIQRAYGFRMPSDQDAGTEPCK